MSEKKDKKAYWITPPDIYEKLDKEFNFNYDPCPYPFNGVDGTETNWGDSAYLNPPFRKSDVKHGKGPIDFIRKAIKENKKGKTVVILRNTNSFINMLIEAGAEMRSMGRVKWLDGETKEPWKSPSHTTCFILRGKKGKDSTGIFKHSDKNTEAYCENLQRENKFLQDKLSEVLEEKISGLKWLCANQGLGEHTYLNERKIIELQSAIEILHKERQ